MTEKSLVGVGLEDGKLLWKVPFNQGRYQTATPVVDGSLVICSGTAYTIEKKGDEFTATKAWKDRAPHQYSTPVLKDGLLYGFTSGARVTPRRGGKDRQGPLDRLAARGGGYSRPRLVLMALSSDSSLVVFKPVRESYTEVARYKVADSPTPSRSRSCPGTGSS